MFNKKCRQLPKFSKSSFKKLLQHMCVSWYTPQNRDNGLTNFTRRGLLSFFQSPNYFKNRFAVKIIPKQKKKIIAYIFYIIL